MPFHKKYRVIVALSRPANRIADQLGYIKMTRHPDLKKGYDWDDRGFVTNEERLAFVEGMETANGWMDSSSECYNATKMSYNTKDRTLIKKKPKKIKK